MIPASEASAAAREHEHADLVDADAGTAAPPRVAADREQVAAQLRAGGDHAERERHGAEQDQQPRDAEVAVQVGDDEHAGRRGNRDRADVARRPGGRRDRAAPGRDGAATTSAHQAAITAASSSHATALGT